MKKVILSIIAILGMSVSVMAQSLSSHTWAQVCSGAMGTEWYSSQEAQNVADIVLSVQKTNGGWMKNDQLHKLSSSELNALKNSRGEHSCLDNYATTQEMRFLAKVYQGTKVEKYREAFKKALDMILKAEKKQGGWSQYWPLSGNGSYQDYITFNDDLMTNVMKMLRDVYENKNDLKDMADEDTRALCVAAFDRGLQTIIKCQIDDNGTKAAWCAQHDPTDYLPTEGRPHELPSVSGYESASLLSFLMTVENPSEELQACITSAVQWLDAHKIPGKAIENYTNAKGESDRRVINDPNSAIWGRFIQIGGESGKTIYNKLFTKLKNRNKSRSYVYNGKTYTYTEYEIATSSYNPDKAYEPIFAIYSDAVAHLYYRFLYNYEDTDPVVDAKGLPIATSLTSGNRSSYQYLGSWCQSIIKTEYPQWKQKMDLLNAAGDAEVYSLSQETYISESAGNVYNFKDGFKVSNKNGKGYGAGAKGTNTIKYSANVDYTITIPEGKQVVKVVMNGYDNYDADAYVLSLNGVEYSATDYLFPAKVSEPVIVTHTFDLAKPAVNTLTFRLGAKQCCLVITLYYMDATTGIMEVENVKVGDAPAYNLAGQRVSNANKGNVVIKNGVKIIQR